MSAPTTLWVCPACGTANDVLREVCYRGCRPVLREAVNVRDLKRRDALVRKTLRIRAEAVLDKNTIEHWNRTHPTESPIDSTWCDEVIAWCDQKGPLPRGAA